MKVNRTLIFLICILTVSAVFLTFCIASYTKQIYYISDEAIDDMVKLLEGANIRIDRDIIPKTREKTTVYLCSSESYNTTVARLIGGVGIEAQYITPTGELILLEDGSRLEFGENFTFRYRVNGDELADPQPFDVTSAVGQLSEGKKNELSLVATAFMDRGSRSFESELELNVETVVDTVWEGDGLYYVILSREIDGVEITKNRVICTIRENKVIGVTGTWSFLIPGESYSAQFSDILNILFNVKKEISDSLGEGAYVTVEAIEMCYSLYFYGENEQFCLMPSVKIATDTMGNFIYNAIDSVLYTKT